MGQLDGSTGETSGVHDLVGIRCAAKVVLGNIQLSPQSLRRSKKQLGLRGMICFGILYINMPKHIIKSLN